MIKTTLSKKEEAGLKSDIKIQLFLVSITVLGLVIVIGIILGIMFVYGFQFSDGFAERYLSFLGFICSVFLLLLWPSFLKFIDIKRGKKLIIKTNNYEIVNKKDTAYILIIDDNKQKIKIDNELVPFLKLSEPLTIEISALSKSLLFISHDNNNLLDRVFTDEKNW